jgi:hypothetical protein
LAVFPLIIKAMAIIRCPYCHAIIDENDKYCNNCGTQLLFPEDEAVEEEIPGEKILDVEDDGEEKDYSLDQPAKESEADDEEEEVEEERTGELVTGPRDETGTKEIGELPEEDLTRSEEEREDEAEEAKPHAAPAETLAPPPGGTDTSPKAPAEEGAAEKKSDTDKVRTGELENGEAEEAGPPSAPATFDTLELESIGKTIELSKERIDKMIEVMARKQEEESPEEAAEPGPEKRTGTLPPWADKIKGPAPVVEREDTRETSRRFDQEAWTGAAADKAPAASKPEAKEAESPEAEEEIFPHRKASDSGIGLPERVTQAALPFDAAAAGEEEAEEAEEAEEEAFEPVSRTAEPRPARRLEERPFIREDAAATAGVGRDAFGGEEVERPPFQFSLFLKAKAFDILFIGIFWLVALWIAARSMGATVFELLSVTSSSVLLLYAAFLGLYFFLFKFFLGETLGDRLFKDRE